MEKGQNKGGNLPEERIWALLNSLDLISLSKLLQYAKFTLTDPVPLDAPKRKAKSLHISKPSKGERSNKKVMDLLKRLVEGVAKPKKNTQPNTQNRIPPIPKYWDRQILMNFIKIKSDEKLLDLLRDVHTLIEEFIAWKDLQQNQVKIKRSVCEYLAVEGEEDLFDHQWKQWQEAVGNMPVGHEAFFQHMILHLTKESHWAYDRQEKGVDRFLEAQSQYIQLMEIGNKAILQGNGGFKPQKSAQLHTKKGIEKSIQIHSSLENNILGTEDNDNSFEAKSANLIKLYNDIEMQSSASENVWRIFMEKCKAQFKNLDNTQQSVLLNLQVNAYIKRIMGGEMAFLQLFLDFFTWIKQHPNIYNNWVITPANFLNFTNVIAHTNIESTLSFIQDFGEYLPKSQREDTLYLARAYEAFCRQDWIKAEDFLEKSSSRRLSILLRKHSLMLRVTYEQFFEGANRISEVGYEQVWDNYISYIKNKKHILLEERFNSYEKLGEIVKKMYKANKDFRYHNKTNKKEREELLQILDSLNQSPLIAKDWAKKHLKITLKRCFGVETG